MIAHCRRLILSLSLAALSALPLSAQADAPPVALAPANNQYFDVFVVYTPAARAYAGSTTAMNAAIQSYVALANLCYANSELIMRMRLVGTAEVPYAETQGGTMNTDLNWLVYDTAVESLARTSGADAVCLVRRGPVGATTGVFYNSDNGRFVVADNYADTAMAFPHELGHNLGARHERAAEGNPTDYGDSYARTFVGNDNVLYRTLMATGPGVRIPYFSNPLVYYQGVPTGVLYPALDASDQARIFDFPFQNGMVRRPIADVLWAGNYSGDGTAELILAGADCRCRYWNMNGLTRVSATNIVEGFTNVWTVFGSGDLDGDGKDDLLFKAGDGRIAVWFMNGSSRTSAAVLPDTFIPANWTPFAAGDLNGDGRDDLLFKHWDGRIAVWYMNGTSRNSVGVLTDTFDRTTRTPFAAGDLDGDGRDDLLFYGANQYYAAYGVITVWFMNGSSRSSVQNVPLVYGSTWKPTGAADYDGDGKDDIVFKSNDDRGAIWFMDGVNRVSSNVLSHTLGTL